MLFAWDVDDWLYETFPSAIGVQRQGSGSFSAIVVQGNATFSENWIFNWRSMELDYFTAVEAGPSVGLSTPLGGGSVGIGLLGISGASSNDSWEGWYVDETVNAYLDLGVYAGGSTGLIGDPVNSVESALTGGHLEDALFVDPASGMNVGTAYFGVGYGTPGFTYGGNIGSTITRQTYFNFDLPFSIIPPGNPHRNRK